jgi:ComF family protein
MPEGLAELLSTDRDSMRLPSLCAVCRRWGQARLCVDCTASFAAPRNRCRRCASAVVSDVELCGGCLRAPPPFISALAAVDYVAAWDRLIGALKFSQSLDLVGCLADILLAAHRRTDQPLQSLLLPVPLGAARLRERGFNPSWEIARRCSRSTSLQTRADVLLRTRDTERQMALSREKRLANVRGAFAINPTHYPRLRGQSVALVADVMSTQATASEAARVLLESGARSVQVWVLARTPPPSH